MKKLLISVFVGLMLLAFCGDALAQTYTKNPVHTNVIGFGSLQKFTFTFLARQNVVIFPFKGSISGDSIYVIAKTYRPHADSAISVNVALEQSPDNIAFKATTIGTDSTTWATAAITSATAKIQQFSVGHLFYGTYPYMQLKVTGRVTNRVSCVVEFYVITVRK